mgnify:CR=1 FL=1
MTVERKYVRFASGIITFPNSIIHSDLADSVEKIAGRAISAGFTDGESCYGLSISLGLKARPDDGACLESGKGQSW